MDDPVAGMGHIQVVVAGAGEDGNSMDLDPEPKTRHTGRAEGKIDRLKP